MYDDTENDTSHGNPLDAGRKLKVNMTFRRHLGRLLDVLYTLDLRPVSRGK